MKTHSLTIRALCSGLGLALAFAVALVASSASAEDGLEPGPIAEPTQSFSLDCTNAGGTVLGVINVRIIGGEVVSCARYNNIPSGPNPAIAPPPGLPACWQMARRLGCPGY